MPICHLPIPFLPGKLTGQTPENIGSCRVAAFFYPGGGGDPQLQSVPFRTQFVEPCRARLMDCEIELSCGVLRELINSHVPSVSPTAIKPDPARINAVGLNPPRVTVAACVKGEAPFSLAATGMAAGS